MKTLPFRQYPALDIVKIFGISLSRNGKSVDRFDGRFKLEMQLITDQL